MSSSEEVGWVSPSSLGERVHRVLCCGVLATAWVRALSPSLSRTVQASQTASLSSCPFSFSLFPTSQSKAKCSLKVVSNLETSQSCLTSPSPLAPLPPSHKLHWWYWVSQIWRLSLKPLPLVWLRPSFTSLDLHSSYPPPLKSLFALISTKND